MRRSSHLRSRANSRPQDNGRPSSSLRLPLRRTLRPRRRRRKRNNTSPKWWNWQTHHLEGVAPRGVRVRVPPSALSLLIIKPLLASCLCAFNFLLSLFSTIYVDECRGRVSRLPHIVKIVEKFRSALRAICRMHIRSQRTVNGRKTLICLLRIVGQNPLEHSVWLPTP